MDVDVDMPVATLDLQRRTITLLRMSMVAQLILISAVGYAARNEAQVPAAVRCLFPLFACMLYACPLLTLITAHRLPTAFAVRAILVQALLTPLAILAALPSVQ